MSYLSYISYIIYIFIYSYLQLEGGSILTSWKKQNSRFPLIFSNFLIDAFVTCYKKKRKENNSKSWNETKTATTTNREKQEKK